MNKYIKVGICLGVIGLVYKLKEYFSAPPNKREEFIMKATSFGVSHSNATKIFNEIENSYKQYDKEKALANYESIENLGAIDDVIKSIKKYDDMLVSLYEKMDITNMEVNKIENNMLDVCIDIFGYDIGYTMIMKI